MPPAPPSVALFNPPYVKKMTAAVTRRPKPSWHNFARRLILGVVLYGSAAVVTLAAIPVLFAMMDRGSVLHWSNRLLDIVGSS